MVDFFKIRADKQEHIISAALNVFSRQGYKKASVADIAEAAGIAKGMVTYYFGSKKNLYLYLVDASAKTVMEAYEKHYVQGVTDFFDRIRMMTEIKIEALRARPGVAAFLSSVFYEKDKEVEEELCKFKNDGLAIRSGMISEGVDLSKFKEGIDPEMINRFLYWTGLGMFEDLGLLENVEKIDEYMGVLYKCMELMRGAFYKE